MNKPLYKFHLNKENGDISQEKIANYEEGSYGNRKYYRYRGKSQTQYIYPNSLDKVKNWTIYSFNSSYKRAKDIFQEYLMLEENKYRAKANQFYTLLGKIV